MIEYTFPQECETITLHLTVEILQDKIFCLVNFEKHLP